ncbi:DUF805 domain-containing protein [Paenibacillus massiliensis]|uniref:DUF805 domain-containing protein n=1 Tax=Paenibacillus massiliensis TaxID=225917 RepID=UPI000372D79C|nr:DUF805 domain-containing protein [Paenibacillus massiliensis]
MEWYLKVLKNYVGFSGRARRKEYWMFALFNAIAVLVLAIIGQLIGIELLLVYLYSLAVMLPSLAVIIRRLHDIGKSGWWYLLSFVPFGAFVVLYFICLDSEPTDNQYGPNPKFSGDKY